MPKHTHSPGERWRLRTPRRIFQWLLRFLGWSAVVGIVGIFAVLILTAVIYFNRARIVNDTLAFFVEPFEVSVEELLVNDIGKVHIKGLKLSPKNAGLDRPMIEIPEVNLTYDFHVLRKDSKVESITLKKPEVWLMEEFFNAMPDAEAPSAEGNPPLDLSTFAFFTDSLKVENGIVRIELEGIPPIAAGWNLETGPLDFDENGILPSPLELDLSNIVIGENNESGKIASASARLTLNQDLSRIDVDTLTLSGIEAHVTPDWFANSKLAEPAAPTTSKPPSPLPEMHFGTIQIGQSSFTAKGFDGTDGGLSFPDLAFETEIEFHEVNYTDGRWKSPEPLTVSISEIAVGNPNAQLASIDRIGIRLDSPGELIHDQTVSEIEIEGIDVLVSDETLARFRAGGQNKEPASVGEAGKTWTLENFSIRDGTLLMQDTTFSGKAAPRFQTALSGSFSDLRIGGEPGFESGGKQQVRLESTSLWGPNVTAGNTPLISVELAELEGNWADFNFDNQIEKLILRRPQITFTDEALGDWLSQDDSEQPIGPSNRPVYKISELAVTGGTLEADSQFAEGRVPKIYSDFTIETNHSDESNPFLYRLAFQDFRLRNHPVSIEFEGPPAPPSLFPDKPPQSSIFPVLEEEVITIREIEVRATANQLQRTRRVEMVKIDGALIRIGNGLKTIVDSGTTEEESTDPSTPNTPTPQDDTLPTWLLEQVRIEHSQVRFETLIPQVEGLEFAIETTLTDVPLSPDKLLAQDKPQKIELAGIEIKDPYNSFITVAMLPTIFVEFSLSGLARQEVERIDLIGPSLHVGQGLFWWIDYQRNFRAQNEGASIGVEGQPLAIEDAPQTPDWIIKTIEATAGKIVIAPTGIPIGMVPFPFNATTNMSEEKTELTLTIPDEDYVYRFPDYKVDLYGLTGEVEFNVPVESVNNNLVQTFNLDRIVWKKYEAKDLYLTVTFDEEGIYGALGGKAYGGYAEGGFNFYLNEPGKWDGWIAGTDMDALPITQALAPENFQMEGPISLKLVSEGRNKKLGVTTGEFQTSAPGWFDIKKFDAILENLPDDWTGLQSSLAELGLYAVKRFDYDKGSGSLYLSGRDGEFDLRFLGPYGSRELTFHLHDERNTNLAEAGSGTDTGADESSSASSTDTNTKPIPEASARPVASRN